MGAKHSAPLDYRWHRLNVDCWDAIIAYLPIVDIGRLYTQCRHLHKLFDCEKIWRSLCHRQYYYRVLVGIHICHGLSWRSIFHTKFTDVFQICAIDGGTAFRSIITLRGNGECAISTSATLTPPRDLHGYVRYIDTYYQMEPLRLVLRSGCCTPTPISQSSLVDLHQYIESTDATKKPDGYVVWKTPKHYFIDVQHSGYYVLMISCEFSLYQIIVGAQGYLSSQPMQLLFRVEDQHMGVIRAFPTPMGCFALLYDFNSNSKYKLYFWTLMRDPMSQQENIGNPVYLPYFDNQDVLSIKYVDSNNMTFTIRDACDTKNIKNTTYRTIDLYNLYIHTIMQIPF